MNDELAGTSPIFASGEQSRLQHVILQTRYPLKPRFGLIFTILAMLSVLVGDGLLWFYLSSEYGPPRVFLGIVVLDVAALLILFTRSEPEIVTLVLTDQRLIVSTDKFDKRRNLAGTEVFSIPVSRIDEVRVRSGKGWFRPIFGLEIYSEGNLVAYFPELGSPVAATPETPALVSALSAEWSSLKKVGPRLDRFVEEDA